MRKLLLGITLCVLSVPAFGAAGIEKACLRSDRQAASRALCGCIQDVADLMLSGKDQKLAVTFFKEPHKAQQTRQSDSKSKERFWTRYKEFGSVAEEFCS